MLITDENGIEDLNLMVRTYNCLFRNNIKTIGDLMKYTGDDLLSIRNFGYKSLDDVKNKLFFNGDGRKLKGDKDIYILSD